MNNRLSRRNLLILTGGAALGAGLTSATTSHAQATASPFTFLSGAELTFIDPWELYDENLVAEVVPDSAALYSGDIGEVVLGFYDTPQLVDDVATALLTFVLGDASLAGAIAGGGGRSAKADGTSSTLDYRFFGVTVGGATLGLYIQLENSVEVGLFVAPAADFGSVMASAQASIQIDGKGVFGNADSAYFQTTLDDWNRDANSGEYTDESGFLHVNWTNSWTPVSQDEVGINLTNQDNSVMLYIARYALEGNSWEEMAKVDVAFLYDDQGSDVTLVGPTVTDSGFSFVTDGEYGPRFAQGSATESPESYVLAFAADFEADIDPADAMALVTDAQANVKINGVPALLGLEEMI